MAETLSAILGEPQAVEAAPAEAAPEAAPQPVEEKATPAVEAKPEASKEAPKAEPKPTPEPTIEKPVEAKPDEAPKVEEKPKPEVNWETDENPYRKRHRDAGAWANKVHQDNLQLQQQLHAAVVEIKKANGTYDPERDEAPAPDPAAIVAVGEQVGKARSSLKAAYELYGQDKVDKELTEFGTLFEGNDLIQARVLNAELPVVEAIRVMKEFRFVKKYGNDTDKIVENMRKELEAELTPQITDRVTKEIMARMQKKESEPQTIRDARAAEKDKGKKTFAQTPLTSIFSH